MDYSKGLQDKQQYIKSASKKLSSKTRVGLQVL